jgi:hypothetical protein
MGLDLGYRVDACELTYGLGLMIIRVRVSGRYSCMGSGLMTLGLRVYGWYLGICIMILLTKART